MTKSKNIQHFSVGDVISGFYVRSNRPLTGLSYVTKLHVVEQPNIAFSQTIYVRQLNDDGTYNPDFPSVEVSLTPGSGNEISINVIRYMRRHELWFTGIEEKEDNEYVFYSNGMALCVLHADNREDAATEAANKIAELCNLATMIGNLNIETFNKARFVMVEETKGTRRQVAKWLWVGGAKNNQWAETDNVT